MSNRYRWASTHNYPPGTSMQAFPSCEAGSIIIQVMAPGPFVDARNTVLTKAEAKSLAAWLLERVEESGT